VPYCDHLKENLDCCRNHTTWALMSSSNKIIDKLAMPTSAVAEMAKAVPTDVVKGIVSDHYRRSAPTPPAPRGLVDTLLEKFEPKADQVRGR